MSGERARVGVLISGNGSNLQALIDDCKRPDHPGEIAVVISNVSSAYGLERAKNAGIPTVVIHHRAYDTRELYDSALVEALKAHGVQWVALAGFMRLITDVFLNAFPSRVLNIHPSILPSFRGLHAQRQAFEHGVAVTGATVHLVSLGMDEGPILAQGAVAVFDDDTENTLKDRILAMEHRLYPMVLRWACQDRIQVDGSNELQIDPPDGEARFLF